MSSQFGILIADNTTNQHHKTQMQQAFRAQRARVRTKWDGSSKAEVSRGQLEKIHDDMYFGDSGYSVGIQMADVCCFLILRHLQGKQDTEFLYKHIEKCIFSAKVEPNETE